jgi:hypothetical protein
MDKLMTPAFGKGKTGRSVGEQIAARQRALEEIDRAQFGWYHVRYMSQ